MSNVILERWAGSQASFSTGNPWIGVVGRVLVAALFIFAGLSKVVGPQPYLDHMREFGVPTLLLPAVITLEIVGGVTLLLGLRLRYAAFALGVFCVLTAVIFHHELDKKTERTHFFKDLAIAGGLLMTSASAEGVRRGLKSSPTPGPTGSGSSAIKAATESSTTGDRLTTRIAAEGVSLAVHRVGRGAPVVCLSAIGHDSRDFDALAARVSDRLELVCVDWPGHGDSGDDWQTVSAARYADLLVAALDRLKLPPLILIGNSVGGAASILYASRRPVRGIVLCGSGGLVELTPTVTRICGIFERFFAAGERGAPWFTPAFRAYYRAVLTQPAAREQRRRIVAGAQQRARLLREAWASFGEPSADIRDVAAELAVPIWAAWGDRDYTVPLKLCLPAIRRMKHATSSTFRAGHAPFLEQPDAFASRFLDFVGALPAPAVDESRVHELHG
jgi:4,5:9,10-diseco-3-hydroxy-5,9,17-trioxoandrosta-1(10),2-diene-4-oate hydrolase